MNGRDLEMRGFARLSLAALAVVLLVGLGGCSVLGSLGEDASDESARTSSSGFAPTPSEPAVGMADSASPSSEKSYATEEDAAQVSSQAARQQLLIRSATMRLRVDDIEATLEKIRDATADFKGQIDDLQVSTESDIPIYRP